MPKSVNEYTAEDRKHAKNIAELNAQFKEIMSSELKSLQGESPERRESQARLYNKFLQLVQKDAQNISRQKSPNQSTYDYLASALTGRSAKNPNDPNEQKSIRKQLNDLFAAGDSEIASYFMSNGMSDMHIYDEIDSICAYMYQLDEAIDIIRDGVLSSEEVSEGISMDIKFEGMSDDESVEHKRTILNMFRDEGMTRKLRSHIIKKAIKYGVERIMIIPYSDISEKLNNLRGGFGTQENMSLFESADAASSEDAYTLESAMADIAQILGVKTATEGTDKKIEGVGKKTEGEPNKPSKNQALYDTICENLKSITVCENNDPPNVMGMTYTKMSNLDDRIIKAMDQAMKDSHKDINSTNARKGTKEYSEGIVDGNSLDGIKGCYQKIVDPRQMRAIKIFDYTIGYYYFENYEYDYAGTTLTGMLSNSMTFDEKTQTVDRLVDAVLGKLKYGDVLSGDKQFRNLILNCLLYAERRDNPIRIKFVPTEYVIEFTTNMDENGNGQPVLLRSLFFARMYISLLLFYITALITKSTDSEFYYLREFALDPRYENQVTDVIDQLQQCNFDPVSIANGQILNATKAINKRYYMSIGTSGEKAFDIDVMSGQNIDINNEFLTTIKKMAISSTGVSSLMIDMTDEIEYATMANMANIKTAKKCNTIQEDFNDPLTKYARLVAKFSTNMPEEIIDKLYIRLRPTKTSQNNITSNQLNDVMTIAENMVKSHYMSDDATELSEVDKMTMFMLKRAIIMELSPSAPWTVLDASIENARIEAKKELERRKVEKGSGDNEGGDSY